jgi:cell division transport system permease protein
MVGANKSAAYFQRHLQVCLEALGRLWRSPGPTLLTIVVIGITLALPASLHLLVKNTSAARYSWEGSIHASLFLKGSVSESRGRKLAHAIAQRPDVASTRYISRAQGLKEFKQLSGFGDALKALDKNPLPAVIVVKPRNKLNSARVQALVQRLGKKPEVDQAKLDRTWLKRLHAIQAIVQRSVVVVAALLAIAVIFVVGNTIRLDIQNRKSQIEIMKLLGASDSFIRRPFLYTGLWYGLWGSLLAFVLVQVGLGVLTGPVNRLASLYNGQFNLLGLGVCGFFLLLLAGIFLGWIGSWLAVGRHLRAIHPR